MKIDLFGMSMNLRRNRVMCYLIAKDRDAHGLFCFKKSWKASSRIKKRTEQRGWL